MFVTVALAMYFIGDHFDRDGIEGTGLILAIVGVASMAVFAAFQFTPKNRRSRRVAQRRAAMDIRKEYRVAYPALRDKCRRQHVSMMEAHELEPPVIKFADELGRPATELEASPIHEMNGDPVVLIAAFEQVATGEDELASWRPCFLAANWIAPRWRADMVCLPYPKSEAIQALKTFSADRDARLEEMFPILRDLRDRGLSP